MKYNDNGEYKDIYIKTFDTLPVGTEVDYDGETVPDGWSEINEIKTITSGASTIYLIKRNHLVFVTGVLNAQGSSGSITLPYKSKYDGGFPVIGYYPVNGNIQGYGYLLFKENNATATWKTNNVVSIAPISGVYYTDD